MGDNAKVNIVGEEMNYTVKRIGKTVVVVDDNGAEWLRLTKREKLKVDSSSCLPPNGEVAEKIVKAYSEAFLLASLL